MGIVYTPNEVVNYILHATNRLLQKEFGQQLSDPGVNILDPFTGTGTFIVNLLQDEELMPTDKLPSKYKSEIWCNEILLLAYYIATINIEYAYHSRIPGEYAPFEGAVLTDTFQMYEEGDPLDMEMFVDNTERILREMETPIHVIVGNPPYSVGQRSANDNNENQVYPTLRAKINESYVAKSDAANNNALYNSYYLAFKWASERIGERGIIAFVSGAGWLDGAAGVGFRRSLIEEFNSIYVFNLRGNKDYMSLTKERLKEEGDNVFASGSRSPIAITLLIKNPESSDHGTVYYHDIGMDLDLASKLSAIATLTNCGTEWDILTPDKYGDWLSQRDEKWYEFAPIAIEKGKPPYGIFDMWTCGLQTNRDSWVYNFSRDQLQANMQSFIEFYEEQIENCRHGEDFKTSVSFDSAKIKWSSSLENYCKRGVTSPFSAQNIRLSLYRPFCKTWAYRDDVFNHRPYQTSKVFPSDQSSLAIALSDKGGCLITDVIPDLELIRHGQWFPLYWYEKKDSLGGMFADESDDYIRHDAITDEALEVFRKVYPRVFDAHGKTKARTKADGGIELTKEDIFYYIYGILHSPEYRQRFEANLKKELPRIPLAEDFRTFAYAGRRLADLHLHYETVEPYELTIRSDAKNPGRVEKMKWGKKKDPATGKKVDDHTTLIYNENLAFSGIPEAANDYKVNGRSPLEWMIDRYQVKADKASGIVNDPNDYSDDPTYISGLIPQLVTVAMDTLDIVNALPPLNEKPQPADWPFAWKASE